MYTSMIMTVGQIVARSAEFLAILSIFIEIVPIKINPISCFLGWIGKKMTEELLNKVNALESKVGKLEKSDVIDCRVRILQFADELRRSVKHSKETFDQALSDIDSYERYCEDHPDFKNNRTVAARAKILEAYSECIDKNSFL